MAMTAWAAKFCNQLDLFVGERPDFGAVDKNGADQHIVLEHRHGYRWIARQRAVAAGLEVEFNGRVVGVAHLPCPQNALELTAR